MRTNNQTMLAAILLSALCIVPGAAWADDDFDQITRDHIDSKTTIWRIGRPNVKQQETHYPEILFQPGDEITVEADGCAQTGGFGPHTWKSYTNPLGPSADHYYSGTIYIPGVIPSGADGYQRIGGQLNKILRVPESLPPTIKKDEIFLNLGYQDDNYSDNGYWGHDDGDDDQCKNKGAAFVVVKVSKGGAAPELTPWSKPFDLTWDPANIDANGLPVNPVWAHQIDPKGPARGLHPLNQAPDFQEWCGPAFSWNYGQHGTNVNTSVLASRCTSQAPTTDFDHSVLVEPGPDSYCHPEPLPGHLEWAYATFSGAVFWDEYSGGWPGDDDMNFKLLSTGGAGLTSLNKGTLTLELKSGETFDNFKHPFWAAIRDNGHNGSDEVNHALLDRKFAMVTGLVGIDGVHGGWTEVHPVMSMAICTSGCRFGVPGEFTTPILFGADQTWAFFLVNYGSGGGCSSSEHHWPGLAIGDSSRAWYFISLPWHLGATRVSSTSSVISSHNLLKRSSPTRWNNWTVFGFELPEPTSDGGGGVDGQITIHYTLPEGAHAVSSQAPPESVEGHDDEGSDLKDVRERLEPALRAQFDELVRSTTPIRDVPHPHSLEATVAADPESEKALATVTTERTRQLSRDRPYVNVAREQLKADFHQKLLKLIPPRVPEPRPPTAPRQ
jgi:hypothetical protein